MEASVSSIFAGFKPCNRAAENRELTEFIGWQACYQFDFGEHISEMHIISIWGIFELGIIKRIATIEGFIAKINQLVIKRCPRCPEKSAGTVKNFK